MLLGPLAALLILVGNALTPGKGYREGPFASQAELRELVDLAEASDVIEDDERQMIHSVFELGDTIVRELMVPRTEMVFIESTKTLRQALSLALRSGFSRIPVIGENVDDVVGVVYLKDLVRRTFEHHEAEHSERVASLMRPVFMVPDSKRADDLLRDMQAARVHMAVVVDEYGGTAGIVTIEDVVEEIVGEITDEYDTEVPEVDALARGVLPGPRAHARRGLRRARRDPDRLRGGGRRHGRRPARQAPGPRSDPGRTDHRAGLGPHRGIGGRAAQPDRHRARRTRGQARRGGADVAGEERADA